MFGFVNLPIDKFDIYIILVTVFVTVISIATFFVWKGRYPSISTLTQLSQLFNTKGGIIILLTFMWFATLTTTVVICLWAILRGVDPSNATLVVLTSTMSGSAWGTVNGALFKTMTGEDPKPLPPNVPIAPPPVPTLPTSDQQ